MQGQESSKLLPMKKGSRFGCPIPKRQTALEILTTLKIQLAPFAGNFHNCYITLDGDE